jgi:hypothetical protein
MALPDGSLLRVAGGTDLWIVFDGHRVRIGRANSNVLAVMGRLPWKVQLVDQATIADLPETTLPSASDIPGSLAFPPLNDEFGSELGKHFVIRTGRTTRVVTRSREMRSITLRGWLHPLPPGYETNNEPGWDDCHYWLDLDAAWAVSEGIDLNAVMRIGNFTDHMRTQPAGGPDFFTWAGTAYIHLEINGWKGREHPGRPAADRLGLRRQPRVQQCQFRDDVAVRPTLSGER